MAPESGRGYPNLLTVGGPTNHTGSVNLTPNVQNVQLLNTVFKFKGGAPLKIYISRITSTEKTYYTLGEILTIIKKVIGEEKMFDDRNPSVILCSEELEQALDQKALHVTEVRDLVMNQIEKALDAPVGICGSNNVGRPGSLVQQARGSLQSETPRLQRTACVATNIQTSKDAKFRLKPLFLIVVRSVEGTNQEQTIFTYEEVTLLLSKYILAKKDVLFDHRNIKLAIVKNDPLGAAFGVSAFHRCQVNALLRSQLIPLHPDSHPDKAIPHTTSAPGVSLSSEHRPVTVMSSRGPVTSHPAISGSSTSPSSSLPPFPALSKAASLPSGSLTAAPASNRKRSSSGEKLDEDCRPPQKQFRRSQSGSCNVIVRRSGESEVDSDTETIYSEQGYDTIKATEVEEDDEEEDDTDMDDTRGFDVEYEIGSEEEEERPPQAHGRGEKFSSADDTDSDINEQHRVISTVDVAKESVYWADSEEEKGETEEINLGVSEDGRWKCISCPTPTSQFIRYCSPCWEIRKGWAPERPRKGKKATKSVRIPLVTPDSGTDDTDGAQSTEVDRPRSETMSSQDSGIGSQDMEQELTETEFVVNSQADVTSSNTRPILDLTKFNRSMSLDGKSEKSSSSIDVSDLSELGSATDLRSKTVSPDLCMFCRERPKNATFIHGRLGHQVCCYPCAKKCWKKQATCPVCKRKVEKIIKIIQA